MTEQQVTSLALQHKLRYAVIPQEKLVYEVEFRKLCEANSCGRYGTNYSCPPAAGEVDALIACAKKFSNVLLYETVWDLEDSFDIEGMIYGGRQHRLISVELQKELLSLGGDFLHLSSGSCSLCERCAYLDSEPCRMPELALPSLECYAVYVSKAAENAGLPYINGENTVTYFGAVFF